jgi:predicted Ser/Thr protein kinase
MELAPSPLGAMICPSCQADNADAVDVCFTCGRALDALTRGAIIASRYEILNPLGRGGMGMVYKAHDRMLDETVAIKVLRAEFVNTVDMGRRFRQEIKLARKVSHRNVCRIHEYGEDAGQRFISMEYLEGTDLKQVIRQQGGVLKTAEAFEIAIQVAEGLQAIHDVGIIHRDLKTPNLMRDARGIVRLMDFGIAKGSEETGTGGMTKTGAVMGTPEYMSPEQCRGDRIDSRSDLYSLGVVYWELFTGQVPFRGDTPVATIFKHIQDPVPFSGDAARFIPPALKPVLIRLLAKDRNQRYATASEAAEALREARDASAGYVPATVVLPAPEESEAPSEPPEDRRLTGRLEIFVNFVIRRVGTLGTVLQEERTIAENIGRGGARVLTSMTSLVVGDFIQIEEIGGEFKTRAEVRGGYMGKDNVRRLNLRFVDSPAPDRLVRTETGANPRVSADATGTRERRRGY